MAQASLLCVSLEQLIQAIQSEQSFEDPDSEWHGHHGATYFI